MMNKFTHPSDIISIRKLERESWNLLGVGFLIAVFIHVMLGALISFDRSMGLQSRYIPVEFVVRPPRPERPFVINERSTPRRLLRRSPSFPAAPEVGPLSRVLPGEAPISDIFSQTYTISEPLSIESITDVSIETEYETTLRERYAYDEHVARRPAEIFSFREEMLSVKDFEASNDGRIKGLVFYNPESKYTIRGIVSLPHFSGAVGAGQYLSTGINELAEAIEMFTDVTTLHNDWRNLYQNRAFSYPLIYISCVSEWEYFPFEADIVGNYLRNGGFAVFENLTPWRQFSQAEASLRQFIRDALGSYARFQPIPKDHPLYHCFFDFDDGPPLGIELSEQRHTPIPYLEGIWIDGRLVAIFSNKGYGMKWAARENNEPQLRMGVNMVVYALLQSGGKTQHFVDFELIPSLKIKRWNVDLTSPGEN